MANHASRSPVRRWILGALSLAMVGGHAVASGCSAGFAPISQLDGLRILAVQADQPYAVLPACTGDEPCPPAPKVTFRMTYADTKNRVPQIVWLGGCFNPAGDAYYACYEPLQGLFQNVKDVGDLLDTGLVGIGPQFSLQIPENIISSRPAPADGAPRYGIAYVFFAACAGHLDVAPAEGTGLAGSFPIGCFDDDNNRLGAESFVPGFTQVYVFADGRTNTNPTITGMTINGEPLPENDSLAPDVEACPIAESERLGPRGCGRKDPYKECPTYDIAITVPDDVADIDPSGAQPDGKPFKETVWVDYFSDRGNFAGDARLVNDSIEGLRPDLAVTWIAPPDPGPARIWAVIHDNRGGQDVIERLVNVQ
ncbi:MAG: hypothetical protein QM820_31100 [Minicystis sp.]